MQAPHLNCYHPRRESRLQYRQLVGWLVDYLGLQDDNIGVETSHSIGNILTLNHTKHKLSMARPKSALPSARSRQHSATSMKVGRQFCRLGLVVDIWVKYKKSTRFIIQSDRDCSTWSERKESLERLLGKTVLTSSHLLLNTNTHTS